MPGLAHTTQGPGKIGGYNGLEQIIERALPEGFYRRSRIGRDIDQRGGLHVSAQFAAKLRTRTIREANIEED